MFQKDGHFEDALMTLDCTVAAAVSFFAHADESLADGDQTAREVLSHLVFWHREYVAVVRALNQAQSPTLLAGSFSSLNTQAYGEFASIPLPTLAQCLAGLQQELALEIRRLPDPGVSFPIKQGGRVWSVEALLRAVEAHIRNHVARLRRVGRRKAIKESRALPFP
jgi:hypothetical protein